MAVDVSYEVLQNVAAGVEPRLVSRHWPLPHDSAIAENGELWHVSRHMSDPHRRAKVFHRRAKAKTYLIKVYINLNSTPKSIHI